MTRTNRAGFGTPPNHVGATPTPPEEVTHDRPAGDTRQHAFEAGRRFHRARIAVRDLTLSPLCEVSRDFLDTAVPVLIATAGGMYGGVDGAVERTVEGWFRDYLDELTGIEHAEWLAGEQTRLDKLAPGEKAEFDLCVHRDLILQPTHDRFDHFRHALCEGLPPRIHDVFRLGELIEHGSLPPSPLGPEPPPLPDHRSRSRADPRQQGFGGTRPPGTEPRLILAPGPTSVCDRPWPAWWPLSVRIQWEACGFPVMPGGGIDLHRECPAEPAERCRLVNLLVESALWCLGQPLPLPVALLDRLRLCDASSGVFRLDGQILRVEDRRAFLVLCHLLDTPTHQATREELQKLPGCDTDISKVIKKLPPELRAIVRAPHGQNSFYYLILCPLPEHESPPLADRDRGSAVE